MKKSAFVGIIILLVFGITVFFVKRQRAEIDSGSGPSPSPYQLATLNSWEGVTPGKSGIKEIEILLGKPEKIIAYGETQKYIFPSTNQYWKNEVFLVNNAVVFIKERLFPPQEQSYIKIAKLTPGLPTRLFGPEHDSGFYLMTYPDSGIAYFVHEPKDTIYEVWRFQPASLRELLAKKEFEGYYISPIPKRE